jgi:hypothetical protein
MSQATEQAGVRRRAEVEAARTAMRQDSQAKLMPDGTWLYGDDARRVREAEREGERDSERR